MHKQQQQIQSYTQVYRNVVRCHEFQVNIIRNIESEDQGYSPTAKAAKIGAASIDTKTQATTMPLRLQAVLFAYDDMACKLHILIFMPWLQCIA